MNLDENLYQLLESMLKENLDNKFPLELFSGKKKELIEQKQHGANSLSKVNWLEHFLIKLFDNEKMLVHGKKYIPDLTLKLSSKKSTKACEIPDLWESELFQDELPSKLTLHQRLFLCRQYLENEVSNQSKNMVVANIGFVISHGKQRKKGGNHKRRFITFPLDHAANIILGDNTQANQHKGTHSEDELIRYLNANVKKIIKDLIENINNIFELGHKENYRKIYAVVLDIHSTAEVCNVCTINLINLQKDYGDSSFMKKLQDELKKQKFMLPIKSLLTRKSESSPNTPVLKLIIRGSGLNSPRDEQYISTKKATHIPANVPEKYPQDIKKHAVGVIFHLPPAHCYPTLPSDVEPIRTARKQDNLKAWPQILEHLIKKGFFSFNLQTGFSNSTTPHTKERGDGNQSGEIQQKEIKSISSLKKALLL